MIYRKIRISFNFILIFLVIIYPFFTQQSIFAVAPYANIQSASSTTSGPFQNGATIGTMPGNPTASVMFTYRGIDDNDPVSHFLCSFDNGPFLQTNCPNHSGQSRMQLVGPDNVRRTYYIMTGDVIHPFPVGDHIFRVQIVSNMPSVVTDASTWRFTVTATPAPSPTPDTQAPDVRITSVLDGNRLELLGAAGGSGRRPRR